MSGLYIHIPFCASRCIYCGFYSTTLGKEQDRYVDALCHEMDLRAKPNDGISSVYIGGGTPSLLSADNLNRLFDHINNVYSPEWNSIEVTMECNPDDITLDFCKAINGLPINRISMGAQTFSDTRLKFLHRRHKAYEVEQAINLLRKHGIHNISIDLMFAFPDETIEEWESDVDKAISLRPEHISAYSLQYEEGTPLYNLLEKNKIHEVDDEAYRQMYDVLCDKLEEAGYKHYEISNFAMPGYESQHNSSYWHDIPYIGLGASAHSYSGLLKPWTDKSNDLKEDADIIAHRSWNISNLGEYIKKINEGLLPSETEDIDSATHYDDTVMTALRTRDGIDLKKLPEEYRKYILSQASSYRSSQELEIKNNHLALTRKGIYVSDMIMSDLMQPDE